MQNHSIGIVLLAAGESLRLGEPKQLLQFRGETLLRRSAKIALTAAKHCIIVLGARFEILKREIEDLHVPIVENKDWQTGMNGSIKIGLETLIQTGANFEGVLITVCDQPFVDAELLHQIIDKFREGESLITACQYEQTLGVPALFQSSLFAELLNLDSNAGARRLIKKYRDQTDAVSFPEGAFDIDTPTDYDNLLKNFS